jgi:hypothetical protein
MRSSIFAAIILLIGSLLAGLGFCALLPPFEGFDEIAHYSYIQQVAQTGTWPRALGPMSAEVEDYQRMIPGVGGASYPAFFAASPDSIQAVAKAIHAERDPGRPWRPGVGKNWEGQHPPLYYAVLAPLWSASKGLSIYAQLFLLRGMSYLFAWGGLVIATISLARRNGNSSVTPFVIIGPALWPAVFPMWFPEMARLGNDSLVLLLLALAWVVAKKAHSERGRLFHFGLLGFLCGLALLTKATALPFVAALGLFLIWRVWCARDNGAALRVTGVQLLVFCLVTVAIAGWWYVENLLVVGNFVGSNDIYLLDKQGGLLKGLKENFSLPLTVSGFGATVMTFLWVGTWSGVLPPRLTELPLGILLFIIVVGWILYAVRVRRISSLNVVALLTLAFFVAAVLKQTLVYIAWVRVNSGAAWYLHSLAPLLAPFVAIGLAETARWRRARWIIGAISIYPLFFLLFATAMELFYFAGCLGEKPVDPHFGLMATVACAGSPLTVLDNLAVFGSPALSIPVFGVGCAVMLGGVVLVIARSHFFSRGLPGPSLSFGAAA